MDECKPLAAGGSGEDVLSGWEHSAPAVPHGSRGLADIAHSIIDYHVTQETRVQCALDDRAWRMLLAAS